MNCCASNKHRLRILIYKLAMQHRSLRWVPYSRQPETCFSVASYRYIRWTPISGIARKPSITWEGVSYSPWQITVFRLLFWLWKNPGVTRDGHSSPFSAEFRFPFSVFRGKFAERKIKSFPFAHPWWEGWPSESQVKTVVGSRFELISLIILGKQGSETEFGTKWARTKKKTILNYLNWVKAVWTQKGGRFPRNRYEIKSYLLRGKRPPFCVWALWKL